MNLYTLAGAGVLAALLAVTVRQYRKELGMAVGLAAGLLLMLYTVVHFSSVLHTLRQFTERAELDGALLEILIRALGVCWITQFAADLCRDAGEGAIAGKVMLAGKIMTLILALPLFQQALDTVFGLLER